MFSELFISRRFCLFILYVILTFFANLSHASILCADIFSQKGSDEFIPFPIEERAYTENDPRWGTRAGDQYWVGKGWNSQEYTYKDPVKDAKRKRYRDEHPNELSIPKATRIITEFLLEHRFLITKSEGEALREYVSDGYQALNAWLRSLYSPKAQEYRELVEYADKIAGVFDRLPGIPKQLVVYRGMPLSDRIRMPEVGDIIKDSAFVSTTSNKENADVYIFGLPGKQYEGVGKENFEKLEQLDVSDLHINAQADRLPKKGIRYVYHLRPGTKALTFDYFLYYHRSGVVTEANQGSIKTESEVLLNKNQKFRVFAVDTPEIVTTRARKSSGEVIEAEIEAHTVHLESLN